MSYAYKLPVKTGNAECFQTRACEISTLRKSLRTFTPRVYVSPIIKFRFYINTLFNFLSGLFKSK